MRFSFENRTTLAMSVLMLDISNGAPTIWIGGFALQRKAETRNALTGLLRRWNDGDEAAESELFPLVYDELHRIAEAIFRREHSGHTLQATAVVHEAYLDLCRGDKVDWQSRKHFYAVMARVMRRVLVDHARRSNRLKRGGALQQVTLDQEVEAELIRGTGPDLLALDQALTTLEELDPDKASLVELRYFAGMSLEEVAELRGVSRTSVVRQWRLVKAWLYQQLS